jgi:hypothetical protein
VLDAALLLQVDAVQPLLVAFSSVSLFPQSLAILVESVGSYVSVA